MQRIALILVLFVLLAPAPHGRVDPPMKTVSFTFTATPLDIHDPRGAAGQQGLRLTGLWTLKGNVSAFGGISALLAEGNGYLTGLTDSGEWARFSLQAENGPGMMGSLPRIAGKALEEHWKQDSESMTRDPVSGRIWVGFERVQRICRYSRNFVSVQECASPPALAAWPEEGSVESLVRFEDGRFLAIGERASAPGGGYEVLLWPGDPVERHATSPIQLIYRAPTGYRPTDAIWLGGDKLLVLNRRLTFAEGFTARLTLVHMPKLVAGAILEGKIIASYESPGPTDNLEALALDHDERGPILWVASDDNHQSLQRTLLFRYALPAGWVTERAAP